MRTRIAISQAIIITGAAALLGGAPAHATTFTSFTFTSNVSTSGAYSDGDIRLDSVTIGGNTLTPAQLQTVNDATIIKDDGVDVTRGGHNFASGQGINSTSDSWAPQGPATITPTSADLRDSLANFNLTSIVVTRENVGTAILDITFANPTNTFFFWERGSASTATAPGNGNSDILIEALDSSDQVTGSYKILRSNYAPTGIAITTWNGSFSSPSTPGGAKPELGSIGLQLDEATTKLRLTSVQQGAGGTNDNGPDYKIIASAAPLAAIPVPPTVWLFGTGLLPLALRARRQV